MAEGYTPASPEDSRDWIFESLARGKYTDLPHEFNLRRYISLCRDQGSRGTCAAVTAVTIKEIHLARRGEQIALSPEFLYYHRSTKPASGMYGRDVFQVMQRMGTVAEIDYPYATADNKTTSPTNVLYSQALQLRIANYARVLSTDGLKRALCELGACYLLLPLYSKHRARFWRKHKNEKCQGGHAVTVIGYNTKGFILQNSWGDDWNGDGSVIFPFSDWHNRLECWVCIEFPTYTMQDDDVVVSKPQKIKKTRRSCTIL